MFSHWNRHLKKKKSKIGGNRLTSGDGWIKYKPSVRSVGRHEEMMQKLRRKWGKSRRYRDDDHNFSLPTRDDFRPLDFHGLSHPQYLISIFLIQNIIDWLLASFIFLGLWICRTGGASSNIREKSSPAVSCLEGIYSNFFSHFQALGSEFYYYF